MNENVKKLNNDELGKISGGFSWSHGAFSNSFVVSSDEKRVLEEGGFIVNGELLYAKCSEAVRFLKSKGFQGTQSHWKYIYLGYKVPLLANLILKD